MFFYVFFVFSHCVCLSILHGESCILYICTNISKTKLCPEYIYNIVIELASSKYFRAIVDNIT